MEAVCPGVPTVLVIRQSRQIGLHEKESHLPDVSSVVTHTTSSEIVGFYDSSTFSLFKNFVIYFLMSVKLFLDRNKELLEISKASTLGWLSNLCRGVRW